MPHVPSKVGAATVHSYGGDFLRVYPGRTIEPRDIKDKGHSPTSHAEAYYPLYCHLSPYTKKLTRDELRERSTKELCCHCDEPWGREHHCKKGQLLMIEPAEDEDNESSKEALEPKEEIMEEESQPANYAVYALAGYSNPLMIAPTKEPKLEDTTLEPKEKDTSQPATHKVPTLVGYTNLQKLKIEGFLE
ncbi:hypothetical protein B296_00025268 [Ensete ventricosum]|uniref:Uncharacterized protein n=1 Tax=Ensete ventricosum TaxID=4639 RepID=A0A426YPV9_ENSVE|nr:hypothetical protein B296_00025268 [Ensete ventricosum]